MQSWKARGHCNLSARDHIFHQTVSRLPVANHVFLGSWIVHICQKCHSLRSAPQRRHTAHLGLCLGGILGKPSGQDQGGDTTHGPAGTVHSPSNQSPELPGPEKGTKRTNQLRLCPCRAPRTSAAQTWDVYKTLGTAPLQSTLEPEQCGLQSTCRLHLWQTNCDPSTASIPDSCQRYLFTVSLPLHRTTKQVSLSKWPPSFPHIRAETRH